MTSVTSIALGIAMMIGLVLLAAMNRRKSSFDAPKQAPKLATPRRETPQLAAYHEALGIYEVTDGASRGGSVVAFRRQRSGEGRAESHGSSHR